MESFGHTRRRAAHLFFVIVLCLLYSTAHSASLLVGEERLVRSQGSIGSATSYQAWTIEEQSPQAFGVFSHTVDETRTAGANSASADASMTSSITDSHFSATASAGGTVSINETSAFSSSGADSRAFFEVTFQILVPTPFDLTGSLSFFQDEGSSRGSAYLDLFDGTSYSDTFSIRLGNSSAYNSFSQNIQLSGMLDPDTYTLRAQASVDANGYSVASAQSGSAAFDIDFVLGSPSVTAVPVPAAAWLFGSALGLLGWIRRTGNCS